jgi:hypothetical protein
MLLFQDLKMNVSDVLQKQSNALLVRNLASLNVKNAQSGDPTMKSFYSSAQIVEITLRKQTNARNVHNFTANSAAKRLHL